METSPCPSTIDPGPMPPKSDKEYGDTSFTGIPSQVIEAAKDLAKRRDVYPRDVFTDAIHELIARMDGGEAIDWPMTRPGTGTRPYHTRLEVGVLEEMRAACDRHQVRKVVFFLAALRDHLRKNGFDVKV